MGLLWGRICHNGDKIQFHKKKVLKQQKEKLLEIIKPTTPKKTPHISTVCRVAGKGK